MSESSDSCDEVKPPKSQRLSFVNPVSALSASNRILSSFSKSRLFSGDIKITQGSSKISNTQTSPNAKTRSVSAKSISKSPGGKNPLRKMQSSPTLKRTTEFGMDVSIDTGSIAVTSTKSSYDYPSAEVLETYSSNLHTITNIDTPIDFISPLSTAKNSKTSDKLYSGIQILLNSNEDKAHDQVKNHLPEERGVNVGTAFTDRGDNSSNHPNIKLLESSALKDGVEEATYQLDDKDVEDIEKGFQVPHSSGSSSSSSEYYKDLLAIEGTRPQLLNGNNNKDLDSKSIEKVPFFNEAITAKLSNDNSVFEDLKREFIPVQGSQVGRVSFRRKSLKLDTFSENRCKNVFLIILSILLLLLISGVTPLIIYMYNGTEAQTFRYFKRLQPIKQESLISELQNLALLKPSYDTDGSFANLNNTAITNYTLFGEMKNIRNQNSLSGLPKKYQNDTEVVEIFKTKNLNNVFYGIDYAPRNVLFPKCGIRQRDVLLDMALLSQVTTRIRTYGMQCNQHELILDSIKELNLNISMCVGVWLSKDKTHNQEQIALLKKLLKKYPQKYFNSVYVGNEVLFREDMSLQELYGYIKEVQQFVKNDLKWTSFPVGVSEIGSLVSKELFSQADIVGANIHPFFGGERVEDAAKWVFDLTEYILEPMRKESNTQSDIVISEIGWPSGGGSFKKAVAGTNELQYFLNTWVCSANKSKYAWYWFEAFDEPWKEVYHTKDNKWETEWGIFTSKRKLKPGIKLPNCGI